MRVEVIEVPDPGPGEALVKVQACGVCHTDLHYQRGAIDANGLSSVIAPVTRHWRWQEYRTDAQRQGSAGMTERRWSTRAGRMIILVALLAFTAWILLPFDIVLRSAVVKPAAATAPLLPWPGQDLTGCPIISEAAVPTAAPGCYQIISTLGCEGPVLAVASHWSDDGGKQDCAMRGWHRLGWGSALAVLGVLAGVIVVAASRRSPGSSVAPR